MSNNYIKTNSQEMKRRARAIHKLKPGDKVIVVDTRQNANLHRNEVCTIEAIRKKSISIKEKATSYYIWRFAPYKSNRQSKPYKIKHDIVRKVAERQGMV